MDFDAGSPWTALSPKDWKLLGIALRTTRRVEEHSRIGYAGYSFERRMILDAKLRFRGRAGNIITATIPELSVLVPVEKFPKRSRTRSIVF